MDERTKHPLRVAALCGNAPAMFAACLIALAVPTKAQAQPVSAEAEFARNAQICETFQQGTNAGPYSPEQGVAACSALIDSGRFDALNLGRLYRVRAFAHVRAGTADRAIDDFSQSATLLDAGGAPASEISGTYAFRGGIYFHFLHDYPRAIADYNEALRLDPQHVNAFAGRGDAHFTQGDYTRAIADYDQALRINPQNANAFYWRGRAYYRQRAYARAIADYDQALRLSPQNAGWLNDRCWARAVWGQQLDQALADCDASLRISADNPNALDSRGLVHLRRSEWQAALTDYDAAVRADADSVSALYGRGIARLRLGQTAQGQADIAAATARDANIAASYASYGVTP